MRVSTVRKKSRAEGATAKNAGYRRVNVVEPVNAPNSWTMSSTSFPTLSAARASSSRSRSSGYASLSR
jgi:hypothetical protein